MIEISRGSLVIKAVIIRTFEGRNDSFLVDLAFGSKIQIQILQTDFLKELVD